MITCSGSEAYRSSGSASFGACDGMRTVVVVAPLNIKMSQGTQEFLTPLKSAGLPCCTVYFLQHVRLRQACQGGWILGEYVPRQSQAFQGWVEFEFGISNSHRQLLKVRIGGHV